MFLVTGQTRDALKQEARVDARPKIRLFEEKSPIGKLFCPLYIQDNRKPGTGILIPIASPGID